MKIISDSINSENWEETIANSGFSFSDVETFINESYNRGYKAKDEEMKAELKNLFTLNMLQTNQIAEQLIIYLNELGIQPLSAYLKIESVFSFSLIFTVNLNDYISDRLLKAYDWTSDMEMKVNGRNYTIDLSFMHGDENVDTESLNSDGFRFKHKKLNENAKQEITRTAQ